MEKFLTFTSDKLQLRTRVFNSLWKRFRKQILFCQTSWTTQMKMATGVPARGLITL
jgi:hypothetical protein